MFVDFEFDSPRQKYPEFGDLSAVDRELIDDQRRRVEEYCSKREVQECRKYGPDVLADIAILWPDVSRSCYFGELEHATLRNTVGAFAGQKLEVPDRGRIAFNRGITEYGCCVLLLEDRLTIEVMRLAARSDTVLVAIDGSLEFEMPLRRRRLPWPFAPRIEEPYELRQSGEVYGAIRNESTWRKFNIAIVRGDGFRMPLPLQFGSSATEVLMFAWRLLTLMPLWSRSVPENRSRVIDPVAASALSSRECVMYFAVSLYFVASVYGDEVLGDAGG